MPISQSAKQVLLGLRKDLYVPLAVQAKQLSASFSHTKHRRLQRMQTVSSSVIPYPLRQVSLQVVPDNLYPALQAEHRLTRYEVHYAQATWQSLP